MTILCLNGGSSSLKFAAYRTDGASPEPLVVARGEGPAPSDADAAIDDVLAQLRRRDADSPTAVGHRIVFGGPSFSQPMLAGEGVLRELESFVSVEPLHLRAELDLVSAVKRRLPSAPQVLCFDTAFHQRAPAVAKRLPLPPDLDPLLRRYGFHGLSYEYVASRLREDAGRTVIAHLGSGASLCALRDGAPVDTTMGFSALGGLMMGTRPGDLDPGVPLRLLEHDGYDAVSLRDLFYRRSGLLGVSGSTADMQALIERAPSDLRAHEAVELFVYQLVKGVGAMVAILGGLQTLVFTGGIGENAPSIRAAVAAAFGHLGLRLDDQANRRNDRTIALPQSDVTVEVIPTDENLMIALHTLAIIGG